MIFEKIRVFARRGVAIDVSRDRSGRRGSNPNYLHKYKQNEMEFDSRREPISCTLTASTAVALGEPWTGRSITATAGWRARGGNGAVFVETRMRRRIL